MNETIATLIAVGALLFFANKAQAGNVVGNERAIRLIKETEKVSLVPYQDEGGTWHIGWGRKIDSPMDYDRITQAQADRWLREDVREAASNVQRNVDVDLTANQYAALVSLVYNIGGDAFANSTLLRKLNNGDVKGAANEFMRWVFVKGEQSAGLRTRRAAEKQVFQT